MAQSGAVSAGQRYIKTYHLTHDRTEWEVVGVRVVGAAVPHAQLVNCRDPFDIRTVACAELTQGGAFDLAEDPRDAPIHAPADRLEPAGGLVEGSARVGRLLRQITLAVRRFRQSRPRASLRIRAVTASARDYPRTDR
jgi:hypothetical protein